MTASQHIKLCDEEIALSDTKVVGSGCHDAQAGGAKQQQINHQLRRSTKKEKNRGGQVAGINFTDKRIDFAAVATLP